MAGAVNVNPEPLPDVAAVGRPTTIHRDRLGRPALCTWLDPLPGEHGRRQVSIDGTDVGVVRYVAQPMPGGGTHWGWIPGRSPRGSFSEWEPMSLTDAIATLVGDPGRWG